VGAAEASLLHGRPVAMDSLQYAFPDPAATWQRGPQRLFSVPSISSNPLQQQGTEKAGLLDQSSCKLSGAFPVGGTHGLAADSSLPEAKSHAPLTSSVPSQPNPALVSDSNDASGTAQTDLAGASVIPMDWLSDDDADQTVSLGAHSSDGVPVPIDTEASVLDMAPDDLVDELVIGM
jgi:hypothetical protein